jgi:hypothetical protein
MVNEPRDRSSQDGSAARARADLSGQFRSYGVVRGMAHDLQGLFKFSVGKEVQKGGLFQLDCQSLLQGVVKNSISGLVFKIRKNDSVLLGEDRCSRANFALGFQPLRSDLAPHWHPAGNQDHSSKQYHSSL